MAVASRTQAAMSSVRRASMFSVSVYNLRPVLICGAIQVACGIALFIVDLVCFGLNKNFGVAYDVFASGIWSGIFHVISGSLGISVRKSRRSVTSTNWVCLLIGTYVMAVLSCILAGSMAVVFALHLSSVSRVDPGSTDISREGLNYYATYMVLNIILFLVTMGHCITAGKNVCRLVPADATNSVHVQFRRGSAGATSMASTYRLDVPAPSVNGKV